MTRRYITLSATGKRVTIPAYCAAIKIAKANSDREFVHGLNTWWSCTGREITRQFLDSIHDRINQGVRYVDRGAL